MAPLRVRHPKGVATLNVDISSDSSTVLDLQQEIRTVTDILPSQQELKTGYPPRSLTLVPELPLSSLGLVSGDQLIVTQKLGSTSSVAQSVPPIAATTAPTATARTFASPVAAPAPSRTPVGAGQPDFVETDAGVLIHRIVPDDNSCLFSSVGLVFEQDIGKASQIRLIVADAIRKDPATWSEAILGHRRDEYISTILKPSSWGGAIELAILANHYATEIDSIDVETGRIDRFTPSNPLTSGNRCVLIYSGIHYDATSLSPLPDAPLDFHQTLYPIMSENEDSDPILKAGKELAGKLRAKRAYTNTATFDLRCEICKKGLKGEKEARAHASETGHTAFGEY